MFARQALEVKRRGSGLEALDSIPPSTTLTAAQLRVRQELINEANRLRDAGVLEME